MVQGRFKDGAAYEIGINDEAKENFPLYFFT